MDKPEYRDKLALDKIPIYVTISTALAKQENAMYLTTIDDPSSLLQHYSYPHLIQLRYIFKKFCKDKCGKTDTAKCFAIANNYESIYFCPVCETLKYLLTAADYFWKWDHDGPPGRKELDDAIERLTHLHESIAESNYFVQEVLNLKAEPKPVSTKKTATGKEILNKISDIRRQHKK